MANNEDFRKARGAQLAGSAAIRLIVAGTWYVPSQSHSGGYIVTARGCTCPDHELRGDSVRCKHRWAISLHLTIKEPSRSDTVNMNRPTYSQPWPQYNAAQCSERDHVEILLRALCDRVETKPQIGRGRPRVPLADVIFSAGIKSYTGLSGRRATSDLRQCAQRGLIDRVPSYNTIFQYMENPEVTPVLRGLVRASARPLTVVEEHFAIDGTGFSTKVYKRWYDAKYGREMKEARWVKLHAVCGVRSKIITAAEVTDANVHDSPLLPQLIQETAEDFRMTEVSADKGYLSRANVEAIAEIGAEPFVAFKLNSTGKGPDAWQQAYHLFSFHKETWLAKYHKRSSIEATFGSLKRLLGGSVRARTEVAMKNEVLTKCVVYNATRLVHALHELGVDPMATLMMNRVAS